MKEKTENSGTEFFDAILQVVREASHAPAQPTPVCINQSRNINNVKINVWVTSPNKPGFFRRLLSKLF